MKCRTPDASRRVMSAAFAVFLALGVPATHAAEPADQKSGVGDLFGGLWAKLRASMKKPSSVSEMPTMTAGLRGAEATESGLKPYWKDDREQDPAYRAEIQALGKAQELADAQKYADAAPAFEAFVQAHPNSPLAPNAHFGGALSRASLGQREKAIVALDAFVKQYPQHPLVGDAQQALLALNQK